MNENLPKIAELSAGERVALEQQLLDRLARRDPRSRVIQRRERTSPLPLSFGQERLWIIDQIAPGLPTYNVGRVFRLHGPLDISAVEQTLAALVNRHEPLRTVIRTHDGELIQVIIPEAVPQMTITDLSENPVSDRDRIALEITREEVDIPFDLSNDLMLRAHLVRLASDDHLLAVTIHHIATDGWSERIFWREFVELYKGFVQNDPVILPDMPIQYADYAAWQRERMDGELMAAQLDYWLKVLDGVPSLDLPTDYPRPMSFSWRGDGVSFLLSVELTEKLQRLADDTDVTLYMLLLAAFELLLFGYSKQTSFALGSPVAGRNRLELESLVGFFVNTVVVRADLAGDPTFLDLLNRVRKSTVAAFDHQEMPFERLVQGLKAQRQPNRHPVFQVMFQLAPQRSPVWSLPGVQVERVTITNETAKFDLLLSMSEQDNILGGRFAFATDLFSPKTIEHMVERFKTLLAAIAADPGQRVSQYCQMDQVEWQQLVNNWNDTAVAYPRDASLAELFERQVALHPDSPALCFENTSISYQELNRQANQIARALRDRGLRQNAVVGLAINRSRELIVAIIGVLKAGGAYLPLDMYAPAARLKFMLSDASSELVLAGNDMLPALSGAPVQVTTVDDLIEGISPGAGDNLPLVTGAEDLACIMYTSGSTGHPKGVAIRQRSVVRLVHGVTYVDLGPQQTLLHLAPLAFDASTFEIWGALLHGSPLVLAPDGLPDYGVLEALIKQWGVSTVWLTAGLFNSIIDNHPQMLSSVRQILTGGETLSVAHILRAQRLLPESQFVNGYGPTENTTFTCCYRILAPLPQDVSSIPIGRPVPNTQVYILDDRLEPVPVGVVGELYAGGDGLAQGYLNRPELNAERFIDNPFEPGTRLFRTGDRVKRLPDGNLEFIGRVDRQIKRRGFRIEPDEIQAHLDRHPQVSRSAVHLTPRPSGEDRLVAYIVPRHELGPDSSQLKTYLRVHLPSYMIPSDFVILSELPLTGNGKIDYRRLEEQSFVREPKDMSDQIPMGPEEALVAAIFREVLDLDHIGRYDNFFGLGGHSLLTVRVANRIADQFELDMSPRIVFEKPTVAEMTDHLREMRAAQGESIERRSADVRITTLRLQSNVIIESEEPGTRLDLSVEEKLLPLWSQVLGVDHVGLHDDFFEMGGHSLLAIQLLSQIDRVLGQRLPAETLFLTRTVAGMAELLKQRSTPGRAETLVPVRIDGREPPFFCVHGFGGGVLGYADLADALKPDIPFYGLQAVGLEGIIAPDDTIEAMAERYLAAVRTVQPNGPYRIGGYCYGGVVAFEMARQLEQAGEAIGLVAIIEGYAPQRFHQRVPLVSIRRWLSIWQNIPYWLNDYWALGLRSVGTQARRRGQLWLKGMRRRLGQDVAFDAQDAVPGDLSMLPQHLRQLMEFHLMALRNYEPQPIDSPISLFAAEGKTISTVLFGSGDPVHGWGELTRAGVNTIIVPGGHRNLHLAPHAILLASALKAELFTSDSGSVG